MSDLSKTAPARLATRLSFIIAGFGAGSLAPFFPFIKQNINADEGQFGLVLLCLGLGSILSMPIAGMITTQYGAKRITQVSSVGMIIGLVCLTLVHTQFGMAISIFVFGASLGSMDVAMNVHATEVEIIEDRPIMSNFHAHFSMGGFLGAGAMTVLIWLGATISVAASVGAVFIGLLMILASPGFMPVSGSGHARFSVPRGIVLLLAILAAITFLVEGALLDWGAILVIERGLIDAQGAGLGFIVFSVAMVAARLTGDRTVAFFGRLKVLVGGGIASIIGIAMVLIAHEIYLALAGFALLGLALANLVPILFTAAGRQRIMPTGLAVAAITTVGYAGLLLGPAMIGFSAQATSLPTAFLGLAVLMAVVPLTARYVARL